MAKKKVNKIEDKAVSEAFAKKVEGKSFSETCDIIDPGHKETLTMRQKGLSKLKMEKIDLSDGPSEVFGKDDIQEVANLEPNVINEITEHPVKKDQEFVINELQYDAFIKSHLEVKEKVLKLQQEVITLKFTTYSTEYKGKYWTWYDEDSNKTWIQEFDKDDILGYVGKLTNAEILKLYLDDKD